MTAPGTRRPTSERANYTVPKDLPPAVINALLLPLISIVTPSYNQGKLIRQTIERVLNQDYPNIEYCLFVPSSQDQRPDLTYYVC